MKKNFKLSVGAALVAGLMTCLSPGVFASDHGDTPVLQPLTAAIPGYGRADARITDFFALKRTDTVTGLDKLALIVDTNPTLNKEPTYTFPTDVTFTANVDNHTPVVDDPVLTPILGGTFAKPEEIRENITFTFTFDAANNVKVKLSSPDTATGISGFYPENAAQGSLVYVMGSGFDRGRTVVRVNGRIALLSYVLSPNMLVFVNPFGATSGPISVRSPQGTAVTASSLTVKPFAGFDFDALANLGTIQTAKAILAEIEAGDVASLAKIGLPVQVFAGLRDDPFIRGPQKGRNIAAMAVELPLSMFTHGRQKVLTAWSTSNIEQADCGVELNCPFATTSQEEVAGRSFGSMFGPENGNNNPKNTTTARAPNINNFHPSQHVAQMAYLGGLPQLNNRTVPPDVMIFDTTKPQAFPNGRELNEDIIDIISPNDSRVNNLRLQEAAACAPKPDGTPGDPLDCPTENDVPHSLTFPYLGEQRI